MIGRRARRSGIWDEMLRDIAVSTDRLWTFVRTLSGLIGEDADSLLVTADEASASAARDLQAQRKATAERVAAFQTKIIESLIASMTKESGLRLDTNAQDAQDALVVINADTAKQINDLASGESGRPFFQANVALRALADNSTGGKHRLGDVVAQLNEVVRELHVALDAELLAPDRWHEPRRALLATQPVFVEPKKTQSRRFDPASTNSASSARSNASPRFGCGNSSKARTTRSARASPSVWDMYWCKTARRPARRRSTPRANSW